MAMKRDQRGINTASKPSGDGCVECLATGGWWLHLRRCTECGHIACCDSSPSQHASKHAALNRHPVVASFEPGEDWFFRLRKGADDQGRGIAAASFASGQPAGTGTKGRVPSDWESLLH
jgi:hypothetical protein